MLFGGDAQSLPNLQQMYDLKLAERAMAQPDRGGSRADGNYLNISD
jgi:plasmid maintenance system antidote protein VapI